MEKPPQCNRQAATLPFFLLQKIEAERVWECVIIIICPLLW